MAAWCRRRRPAQQDRPATAPHLPPAAHGYASRRTPSKSARPLRTLPPLSSRDVTNTPVSKLWPTRPNGHATPVALNLEAGERPGWDPGAHQRLDGGSGGGGVDVLVQSSLGQARIVDGRRGVRCGVDVVGHIGTRLVDIKAVLVVVGAHLARVGAWHQVAGVGPGGHDGAAHRRDVDVVTPEPKPPGAVGLPT